MQWFKDRRTATKLMLSFGFLTVLMCGLGILGLRGMSSIQAQLRELHQYHALGVLHLEKANTHLIASGRSIRGALLTTDPAQIEQRRQEVLDNRKEFYDDFEQYRKSLLQESAKAKASDAMAVFKDIYAQQDLILEALRSGQHQQALAPLPALVTLAAKADQLMNEFSKHKQDRMQEKVEDAEKEFASARTTMIVVMILAAILALGLGFMIAQLIARPLAQAVRVLEAVGGGDFTVTLEANTQDEVGQMARSLNTAVGNMRQALLEVSESSGSVSEAAQQLAAASEEVSSGAQEQASSLEETASSLEQMTSTVKQNAENARQASQLASGSRESAEKGGQVVKAAVVAMGEINQASKSIAEIITTIDEIAFQTNLLALNAAVEAARAGEQGRGFAVVAAEVRNLAQRSATAAKEIKGLIQDSVRKVDNGSELVNKSGQTLEEIVQSVKRVTDIVAEIAAASQEQASGIEQVNKATLQMDQVTQGNTAQTEEMSSTAQGLSASAEQLQAMVGRFKLSADTRAAGPAHTPSSRRAPATAKRPPHAKTAGLKALAHHTTLTSHTNGADHAEKEAFEEF
jgi:methyl-accepting chemotaxis protein